MTALAAPLLVALVLIGALAAGPAAAYTSDTSFTITGHGWGHGIGLSQWGAYGCAKHGWTYEQIIKHYYTGVSFGAKVPDKDIRVLLQSGLTSVRLSCPNDYTAQGTGESLQIPGGTEAVITLVDGKYRVAAGAATKDFGAAPTFTPSKGSLRVLTKTDLGRTGAYRGVIRVLRSGSKLQMINSVPLESYLRGVVPHEVSPSWPVESLKAQAVAARAYAEAGRNAGASWDVHCDVRSQAYAGVGIEDPRTDAAIEATAGVAPRYNGKVITGFFFSCSGGRTENIEFVWSGASPLGYLKGVSDPYDTYGTLHNWGPVRRTASKLKASLGTAVKGKLRAVYRVKKGTSPRIVKAAIIGSGGVGFIDGSTLRMKAGLNSTWAIFTSMSISPAPGNKPTISAGQSLTLKGRLYPALKAGSTVKLYFYYGGKWRSRKVATSRVTQQLGQGYKAVYSTYSAGVSPAQTTKYYFSSGNATSPTTTVTVK